MLITSNTTPTQPQRFDLDHDTHVAIQIRGAFTVTIGFEMGEVQNPNDGLQLTQANTSPPFKLRVRGNLWHVASVNNSQWVLCTTSEEKQQYSVLAKLTEILQALCKRLG